MDLDDAVRGWGIGTVSPDQDSEEDEDAKKNCEQPAACDDLRPKMAVAGKGEGAVIVIEAEYERREEESTPVGWTVLAPTIEGLEVGQAALVDDDGILCESV